jgi:Bacterial Ig-like domain (group 2)
MSAMRARAAWLTAVAVSWLAACSSGEGTDAGTAVSVTASAPALSSRGSTRASTASSAVQQEISQLYVALFGRAPDTEGLDFWAGRRSGGESMAQLADAMYGVAPARVFYPLGLAPVEVVASFYRNVLGRDADAGGLTYWTGKLTAAGATPGSVIAELISVVTNYSGTSADGLRSAQHFSNRVTVALYYALRVGAAGTGATRAVAGVTHDAATVSAAIAAVDSGIAVSRVQANPASNTIDSGTAFSAQAAALDASGNSLLSRTASWSSSNAAVATVDASGTVRGLAAGSATITARIDSQTATVAVTVTDAAAPAVTVTIDSATSTGTVRDVFGVNRKPIVAARTPGVSWDASALYAAFGASQVRLHDSGADVCTTYTAATRQNMATTPPSTVSGCQLSGSSGLPHFRWTPSSSADADLDNPANYDFTEVDAALRAAIASGAQVYLRLGESYNGPNDTADPVAWAKVATNIYRHVIGVFKPTAGIAVDPVHVEVFNEPDGGFWRGSRDTFLTLFRETVTRVRAAAAASGKTVRIGGPGFTRSVLTAASNTSNAAYQFVAGVGLSSLDFYSAHLYDSCETASMSNSATFLRSLRSLVDSQGGNTLPLHITEWNIGLDRQCTGTDLYADARNQSFTSGILTLMQSSDLKIEAAHFYAGTPIMAMFDFSSAPGSVMVNPSSWSLWAHSQLRGHSLLDIQVCPRAGSCVSGLAAERAALAGVAASKSGVVRAVLTNDSASSVAYTLQVRGLASGNHDLLVRTPPSTARALAVSAPPTLKPSAADISSLMAAPSSDTRARLVASSGTVRASFTLAPRSIQWVEIRPATP